MIRVILIVALLLVPSLCHAQRRCVTPQRVVVANSHVVPQAVAAVAPVVVAQDVPDVYVVQNNNPAPLVAQGNTLYRSGGVGLQSAVLPFFDPNAYFQQELELQRAANQTAAMRVDRTNALVERIAALQAPALETFARGQAASMVLSAAGLDDPTSQAQSLGVVITRDSSGQVVVTQISPDQAQAVAQGQYQRTSQVQASDAPVSSAWPVTQQFCGSCHGQNRGTPPSGGFYIGDTEMVASVMRDEWFALTNAVSNGTMPPASSPQPSREQRAQILDELQQIISKYPE